MFVANASDEEVFFAQMVVEHIPQLIVQENHYYPFGLELAGLNKRGKPEHRWTFNEVSEKTYEPCDCPDGVGKGFVYETKYRQLDPQLGRWRTIDPKADTDYLVSQSPYSSMDNNPILKNDPNGDCPWCAGALIGIGLEIATQAFTGELDFTSGKTWRKIAVSGVLGAAGVGVASKLSKVKAVMQAAGKSEKFVSRAKQGIEAAWDASANATAQYINTGDVDAGQVLLGVGVGNAARKIVGSKVSEKMQKTPKHKQNVKNFKQVKGDYNALANKTGANKPYPGTLYKAKVKMLEAQDKVVSDPARAAGVATGAAASSANRVIYKGGKYLYNTYINPKSKVKRSSFRFKGKSGKIMGSISSSPMR